ncbi:MAG: hypothetical protein KFF77_08290 [Bacteroidetes bacterium]|nr:hypothetical protein [Bacteroidota bacterium]
MKRITLFLLAVGLLLACASPVTAQTEVHEKLLPFKDLLGRTYKGKLGGSDTKKEQWDVMRFDRWLNGNAIRILHSVNEGEYGGETILFWDEKKQSLVYYYFTTAGFHSTGTMKMVSDSKWISHETITGNQNGITEVKSTGEMTRDGFLKTSSEYLRKGKWVPGHSAIYEQVAFLDVKFK